MFDLLFEFFDQFKKDTFEYQRLLTALLLGYDVATREIREIDGISVEVFTQLYDNPVHMKKAEITSYFTKNGYSHKVVRCEYENGTASEIWYIDGIQKRVI